MSTANTDWDAPDWPVRAESRIAEALVAAGRPPLGPVQRVKSWGRARLHTVPTEGGLIWVKHGYGLPPGEEQVLPRLARRWPALVPQIVTVWPGAIAMEALPGRELAQTDREADWTLAARAIAELEAGESVHARAWLELGVRDRRPAMFRREAEALLESPVVHALEAETVRRLESLLPQFVTRYDQAFGERATLVHQDSGCCNIHVGAGGPVLFDWADVVVGHPVFSCDRLLDQTPSEYREAVIEAFLEPLEMARGDFDAVRRSNVLHEVLRYHDELAHLPTADPLHASLAASVQSQLRVLVDHEWERRS